MSHSFIVSLAWLQMLKGTWFMNYYYHHTNSPLLLVNGFSSGAAGCAGDGPAVGGAHIDGTLGNKNITTISFKERNVTLQIGGIVVPQDGTGSVVVETITDIVVSGINIKGVLFRLSAPDNSYNTTGIIKPLVNTRTAFACTAPVVGITHTSAVDKPFVTGTLLFPKPVNGIVLDLTLVWFNNDKTSFYSYGKFLINVSPAPTPISPPTAPSSCFSGENTVEVKDIGDIPMSQLKIGDYVKTLHGKYTQVYGFGHYDHNREETYVRFKFDDHNHHNDIVASTGSGSSSSQDALLLATARYLTASSKINQASTVLEISSKHLVFVNDGQNNNNPIPASNIMIGDMLSDGNKIVTSIDSIIRRGVYAPLTQSGDIIVSGIHSSNYIQVLDYNKNWIFFINEHMIGHTVSAPQRIFCSYYIEYCKMESYMNGYGYLSYINLTLGSVMNRLGWFINSIIVLLLLAPVVGYVYMIESLPSMISWSIHMIGITVCVVMIHMYRRK